ncbi:MAG: hypothetical protein ACTSSP_11315, partial [Candidatus Asgardarchaeia archaeon]
AIPGVTEEARRFAARQRMHILEPADLKAFLARSIFPPMAEEEEIETEMETGPFQFKSKSELIDYLHGHGYKVKQKFKYFVIGYELV